MGRQETRGTKRRQQGGRGARAFLGARSRRVGVGPLDDVVAVAAGERVRIVVAVAGAVRVVAEALGSEHDPLDPARERSKRLRADGIGRLDDFEVRGYHDRDQVVGSGAEMRWPSPPAADEPFHTVAERRHRQGRRHSSTAIARHLLPCGRWRITAIIRRRSVGQGAQCHGDEESGVIRHQFTRDGARKETGLESDVRRVML